MSIKEKINQWRDNLSMLEGMDKFQYLVDVAKDHPPMDSQFKIESFKIKGCASSLWVAPVYNEDKINFLMDADAFITKGYAKIVVDLFDGEKMQDIINCSEMIDELGIKELLTPQRQSGLGSLVKTIKSYCTLKIDN